MALVKTIIRTKFSLTSKAATTKQSEKHLASYLQLAEQLGDLQGQESVQVPKMIGVDEEMRGWSFYELLEHNVIVNRVIKTTVSHLVNGESLDSIKGMNPKSDVMPSSAAGAEQVEAFKVSTEDYLKMVEAMGDLKGTKRLRHPVFGHFDAHMWHCMFAFHLKIHLKQAQTIVRGLR